MCIRDRVYTEQNGNFDVALLDIMMPGMDGFALCRWIREQSSEIGIIMLSAKLSLIHIAHRMEEMINGKRIIRPAYKAINLNKNYIPLSQRI